MATQKQADELMVAFMTAYLFYARCAKKLISSTERSRVESVRKWLRHFRKAAQAVDEARAALVAIEVLDEQIIEAEEACLARESAAREQLRRAAEIAAAWQDAA